MSRSYPSGREHDDTYAYDYWAATTGSALRCHVPFDAATCAALGSTVSRLSGDGVCDYCGTRHESIGNCINCGAPKT